MQAMDFWKTVVRDNVDMLGKLFGFFEKHNITYCIIGGQGVNAYAEPVVSLDLDVVLVTNDLQSLETDLKKEFVVQKFEHRLNISLYGSDLRVQIQTDPRYADFPSRAEQRTVLGLKLPVAALADLLQGKLWAVLDPTRRASKRQKDLADIARLLESHPEIRANVPESVLDKLI